MGVNGVIKPEKSNYFPLLLAVNHSHEFQQVLVDHYHPVNTDTFTPIGGTKSTQEKNMRRVVLKATANKYNLDSFGSHWTSQARHRGSICCDDKPRLTLFTLHVNKQTNKPYVDMDSKSNGKQESFDRRSSDTISLIL